jgi:hypothetical protein
LRSWLLVAIETEALRDRQTISSLVGAIRTGCV